MAKRLVVILGMLALMLTTALPAAMAQEQEGQYADASQYETLEVSATGILRDGLPQDVVGDGTHSISDEATGELYALRSASADLDTYIDQRVTVYGPLTPGEDGPVVDDLWSGTLPSIDVLRVQPLSGPGDPPPGGPMPGSSATFAFELIVECEPPADAEFLGFLAIESLITTSLTDSDGDGVYTGSQTVPKFAPGPMPPGTEPISLSPVRIVQGPPTGFTGFGPEYRIIKDFGAVTAEDTTLSARVSFDDEPTDPVDPGVDVDGDGTVDASDGEEAARISDSARNTGGGARVLPDIGGATLVLLSAGAILAVAVLLVHRTTR